MCGMMDSAHASGIGWRERLVFHYRLGLGVGEDVGVALCGSVIH